MQEFDYSMFEEDPHWSSDSLSDPNYWGIHLIDGKMVIDVQRYKKTFEGIGAPEFIPQVFMEQRFSSIEPLKKQRYDYKINLFRDLIAWFKQDWIEEYKPIFKMIKTPLQAYEGVRLNGLMTISSSDDIELVEEDAMLSSFRRVPRYERIIQSLYCTFISKLSTEIDRYILIVMCELGYKGNDYDFQSFLKFSDGLQKDRNGIRMSELRKYNAYNLLHKINNFLKHNSVASYNSLKNSYPNNVRSIENGTSDTEYENGMFAGDWIVLKEDYIDSLLNKLVIFFEEYCQKYLSEDLEESKWNYNDYFLRAVQQISNPYEYFGIP